MTSVTETFVVTYDNVEHKQYAELCMRFGFDMTVSASLKVGMQFMHPSKRHMVMLELEDPEEHAAWVYCPKFSICTMAGNFPYIGSAESKYYNVPNFPGEYSEAEFKFVTSRDAQGNEATPFEVLERELEIWINVRPRSLNTVKQIG